MPTFFGLAAMPTTLLNSALGVLRDRSVAVRGPDRVAVVAPMYNEQAGAERALASLLHQSCPPDELAISVNGATDATLPVVRTTLSRFGFACSERGPAPEPAATLERWRHPRRALEVLVLVYLDRTAKAASVNHLLRSELLRSERLLLVDGDTVLEPHFLRALKDQFYRLRRTSRGAVVEDFALQSGSVTSLVLPGASREQRFIAAGRSAEYAFSTLLRRGQTRRLGGGALWGASRLYTVVGCGFTARRDVLPVPAGTLTEDHDLTLRAQSNGVRVERLRPAALAARGFRIVRDGAEVAFDAAFDRDDVVELRHTGDARFVGEALMHTQDPEHLGGYLRQIERWNAGGLQNALERLPSPAAPSRPAPGCASPARARAGSAAGLPPNVRFAVGAAQAENLLGLLLLLAFPALLALGLGRGEGWTAGLQHLGLWLGFDAAATGAMALAGFYLQARQRGLPAPVAGRRAFRQVLRTWLPFAVLKALNPISYVAAASRVLPAYARARSAGRRGAADGAWERPSGAAVDARTLRSAAGLTATFLTVFLAALWLVPPPSAEQRATLRLLRGAAPVDIALHEALPPVRAVPAGERDVRVSLRLEPAAAAGGAAAAASAGVGSAAALARPPGPAELSAYCAPSFLREPAGTPRRLEGDARAYRPLTAWERLVLARLAPLAPYLEQAATAYDVRAGLLLQVLLHESFLDPLAVGPTDDKGLSQMTSDALRLLRAVSEAPDARLYNPRLLAGTFNVFDPDFSICAGAAKLAWARSRSDAVDDAHAYALYINPLDGLTPDGRVARRVEARVEGMLELEPLARSLADAYAAYREGAPLAAADRALLDVSADLAAGRIDLARAYRSSRSQVLALGLDDVALYDAVLDELFPRLRAGGNGPERASAR